MPFITVSAQLKSLFTYLKRSDRIGFSQPRMTQSRRNPQLRHAAAGSRRNGFRHLGYPIHRARLFRNRTGILRIQSLPVQKAATDQCSSQSSQREQPESQSKSSSRRVHPTPASHQPSPISQHSPSFSISPPLFSVISYPLSSVQYHLISVSIQSSLPASNELLVVSLIRWCNPSGLHWTPCYIL